MMQVRAVRFITDGTIEERMLELQEKKQLIFECAVDSNAVSEKSYGGTTSGKAVP